MTYKAYKEKVDLFPPQVRRALRSVGANISVARRRRRITVRMMAERVGVSAMTYLKVERGDPGVAFGTYVMTLFALGLGTPWAQLVDAGQDETGLLLDLERVPKRARPRTEPPAR